MRSLSKLVLGTVAGVLWTSASGASEMRPSLQGTAQPLEWEWTQASADRPTSLVTPAIVPMTQGARRRVSLQVSDSSLKYVVYELARQAGLRPVYDDRDTIAVKRVSVNIADLPASQAFNEALKGTGFTAKIAPDGETVVIRTVANAKTPTAPSQVTGTIAGRVVDSATQSGVDGVTVSVVGTRLSAVTQPNGNFRIGNVPPGERRIVAKRFGYRSAEQHIAVPETGSATVRFTLSSLPMPLTSVVTTATGLQRRVEVNTDVTRLNVDSIMATAPIMTVTDLLATRVPGLQVTNTTGAPGDPSRLRLRGVSSINASNAPIVIVNGIRVYSPDGNENPAPSLNGRARFANPSPLDQIDPNSIETIEVFKGPSASSLYGSDAANGVIVITTKRGRVGPTRMTVSLSQGTANLPGKFPENRFVFGHGLNSGSRPCEFDEGCTIDSLVTFQALNDPRYSPIGRGSTSTASGTVSGANQAIQYSFTGSTQVEHGMTKLPGIVAEMYRNALGRVPPSWMRHPDRYTIHSGSHTLDITPSPSIQFSTDHRISWSEQRRTSLSSTMASQLVNRYIDPDILASGPGVEGVVTGYQDRVRSTNLSSQHGLSVLWRPIPTVPLRFRTGFNPGVVTGVNFLSAGIPVALGGVEGGAYGSGEQQTLSSTIGGNTTIPVRLTNGVQLDLSVGSELTYERRAMQTLQATHLDEGMEEPSSFHPEFTRNTRVRRAATTYGIFLEPRFTIGSRLFFQTGVRMDGGSASGDRAGLTRYPKLGLSWLVLDNSSIEHPAGWSRWISQLRITTGLGHAGEQPDPTQHLRLLAPLVETADGGETTALGFMYVSNGNTRLRPERGTEFEGGAEVYLFSSQRLMFGGTWYRKHLRDAIMSRTIAGSVGTYWGRNAQPVNVGNVLNTGYDLRLNGRILDNRSISWITDVALSRRNNELTKKTAGMDVPVGGEDVYRFAVGYPVYGYWGRPVVGFADQDGDGVLRDDEIVLADSLVYRGTSEPRYTATVATNLSLFNGLVTLSASMEYQHSLTQYNQNASRSLLSSANAERATLLDQAIAQVSNGYVDPSGQTSYYNYYLLQTVNVLRFHSLSLSCLLPKSVATTVRMRQATLALQGSNLGIKTGYRGIDPNVNSQNLGNLSMDAGHLPQPRTWQLRVNLTR